VMERELTDYPFLNMTLRQIRRIHPLYSTVNFVCITCSETHPTRLRYVCLLVPEVSSMYVMRCVQEKLV